MSRRSAGLVDRTVQVLHPGKRGTIEAGVASVFEMLGAEGNAEQRRDFLRAMALFERAWAHSVHATESDFYRVIGADDGILANQRDQSNREASACALTGLGRIWVF